MTTILLYVLGVIIYLVLGVAVIAGIQCFGDIKFDGEEHPPVVFVVIIWPAILVLLSMGLIVVYALHPIEGCNNILEFCVNYLTDKCRKVKENIKARIQED